MRGELTQALAEVKTKQEREMAFRTEKEDLRSILEQKVKNGFKNTPVFARAGGPDYARLMFDACWQEFLTSLRAQFFKPAVEKLGKRCLDGLVAGSLSSYLRHSNWQPLLHDRAAGLVCGDAG